MKPQKYCFLSHFRASKTVLTKARLLKHDFPVHGRGRVCGTFRGSFRGSPCRVENRETNPRGSCRGRSRGPSCGRTHGSTRGPTRGSRIAFACSVCRPTKKVACCESVRPVQGSKSPKSGKEGVRVKKPPFLPTHKKGSARKIVFSGGQQKTATKPPILWKTEKPETPHLQISCHFLVEKRGLENPCFRSVS